jgi:hypothetical protein
MELKQKYTEEFEIDEIFLEQITQFENGASKKIALLVDKMHGIESTDGLLQNKTGHVNDDDGNPVFFCLEYFRGNHGPIVLTEIKGIEVDEYLDSINKKINIK